jgi:hypothetical protein
VLSAGAPGQGRFPLTSQGLPPRSHHVEIE